MNSTLLCVIGKAGQISTFWEKTKKWKVDLIITRDWPKNNPPPTILINRSNFPPDTLYSTPPPRPLPPPLQLGTKEQLNRDNSSHHSWKLYWSFKSKKKNCPLTSKNAYSSTFLFQPLTTLSNCNIVSPPSPLIIGYKRVIVINWKLFGVI